MAAADSTGMSGVSRESRSEVAQAAELALADRDRPSARPERPVATHSLAAAAAPSANEAGMRKLMEETPEAWLKRLAELRQQGRIKEFDEGLAGFRKRHPDYRIPEALLAPR